MSSGLLMIDIEGLSLTAEDRELLLHPAVCGIILFARNYHTPAELLSLTHEIHQLRSPPLLIGVDQEGGRVQRFRQGLTRLPSMQRIAEHYVRDKQQGLRFARLAAWVMSTELRALSVDFSFAPVLDLDRGLNAVIGDRAFGSTSQQVCRLATAWIEGMNQGGMQAVGKHFPGHGGVTLDSHEVLPVDYRLLTDLLPEDMVPFKRLLGKLAAIMPAHVWFPAVDDQPVGFSSFWLKRVLRGWLKFEGIICSDDLNMKGAGDGSFLKKTQQAEAAGCDMILICNNRAGVISVLDDLHYVPDAERDRRLSALQGGRISVVSQGQSWRVAVAAVKEWTEQEHE